MIIFYQKSTGKVIGTVEGRVHSEKEIKDSWIQPNNIDKSDIVKYVVPYKPRWEKQKDGKKKIVELLPDGPLAKIVVNHEKGVRSILKAKIKLPKK